MGRTTSKDAQALIHSLRSAYAATPTSLKIIDLYVGFAVLAAIIQGWIVEKRGRRAWRAKKLMT